MPATARFTSTWALGPTNPPFPQQGGRRPYHFLTAFSFLLNHLSPMATPAGCFSKRHWGQTKDARMGTQEGVHCAYLDVDSAYA